MKFIENASLKEYNTFNIDCCCKGLFIVEQEEDYEQLFEKHVFDEPFLIVGEGSNILFTGNFDGNVIHLTTKGMKIINEDDDFAYIRSAGGENWSGFVRFCISNELYGSENLISIPGLVGSCPVQNIGAYGVEAKDIIYQVEGLMLPKGEPFVLYNEDCNFAYRDSIFKNELKEKCLISNVVFKLKKKPCFQLEYKQLAEELGQCSKPLSLSLIADTITRIRNSKLPDISKIGCAGSFFKNPVISAEQYERLAQKHEDLVHYPAPNGIKLAAGQLIERCGWKEIRRGDVSVYPKQALVIVNWGNAASNDVVDYYKDIIASVFEHFGVIIEPEVRIV